MVKSVSSFEILNRFNVGEGGDSMGVFEFLAKGVGTVLLSATGVASLLIEAMAESGGLEDLADLANQGKEKSFEAVQGFWKEKPNVELTEEQLELKRAKEERDALEKKAERIEREIQKVSTRLGDAKRDKNEQEIELYKCRLEDLEDRLVAIREELSSYYLYL